jgi:hypothetical protein
MPQEKKTNYLKGSVRARQFDNDEGRVDEVLYMSIASSQVVEFSNEKGYTSIEVRPRREIDEYGNTHYLVLRTPEEEEARRQTYLAKKQAVGNATADTVHKPRALQTADSDEFEPPF